MREQEILTQVTAAGMFQLSRKGKKTSVFQKQEQQHVHAKT
jgi:hypothetical protein